MAAKGHVFCRLALQNANNYLIARHYAIRPPVRLGGVPFKKFKGIPYDKAKTFAEKIAERQAVDPEIAKPINVGATFSPDLPPAEDRRRLLRSNNKNEKLEYAARHRELLVDLETVREDWLSEYGPQHIRTVADHYGIYADLFGGAYFLPTQRMTVAYDYDDDTVTPVYYGNSISPDEASIQPHIEFDAEPDSLYTLLMSNPDGHLTNNNMEYLHWLVGNIPGANVTKGEVLCDYLKPFPPEGTGFHRHVFVLFKQKGRVDFTAHKRSDNCVSLKDRTFETVEFFRSHQEELTPVALNFFQSEWDSSVQEVYHNILNMREPKFEYQNPPPYHPPQEMYPKKQPFDRYMDRYRDKKDIAEEVMRLKLSRISPFKDHPSRPKYPLIHEPDPKYKPSWQKRRENLIHRRIEQFKDLP